MSELHKFICCPTCKEKLQACTEGGEAGNSLCYACAGCGLEYPVADDVLDLLPHVKGRRGLAQKLMESERIVRIYESKWWRGCILFKLFAKIGLNDEMALIENILDLGPEDTVLDLACGTGLYARRFAGRSPARKIVGLDISRPMLGYATKKTGEMGIENVTFIYGDAHHLPFEDSSLNGANCCGGLHLFKDVRGVLRELHRVIRPNGRFSAAMALNNLKPFGRLKAFLDGKFWGIHYFRRDELRELLDEAGFEPTIYHAKGIWMVAGGARRP